MLMGSADPGPLFEGAPRMASLDTGPLELPGAEFFQLLFEIGSSGLCDRLPPALHPTLPPALNWSALRLPETPWGPVQLVQTRLQCRSGLRPRGLLRLAVVDNGEAAGALAAQWGYRVREGSISFRSSYAETRVTVDFDGARRLEMGGRSPRALERPELQIVAGLHPAHTPRGPRLVQVDPDFSLSRTQRLEPFLEHFDAGAWGDESAQPVYPVSAALARGDVTLPRLRYLCRPDVLAFEGTEVLR